MALPPSELWSRRRPLPKRSPLVAVIHPLPGGEGRGEGERIPVPDLYPKVSYNQSATSYPERLHDNNFIIKDLQQTAGGRPVTTNGHSYEVAGFLHGEDDKTVVRKTFASIAVSPTNSSVMLFRLEL